jgi:hypothetical protein
MCQAAIRSWKAACNLSRTFPLNEMSKYRAVFDPRPLGASFTAEPFDQEFLITSEQKVRALTTVTHVFPSCDLLPENLLRFYVCFSDSMQRGRALDEISGREALSASVNSLPRTSEATANLLRREREENGPHVSQDDFRKRRDARALVAI